MSRKPNTDLRRSQIVDALRQVMAVSGYSGATIHAIAAKSGLAPGLVHYHFHDKHEILVELVESLAAYARARYDRRVAHATTSGERLQAYIDARLAFGDDAKPDAVAAWVMIGAEAVRDTDVRKVYQDAVTKELALARELLRACLRDAGKRVRKLDELAAGLLAYTEGAFVLASNARDLVPKGFAAPLATEWIGRYINSEEERPKPAGLRGRTRKRQGVGA
ncbi:MAG: TetR/AcrR family transcriptional regulator [Rudaea sp.]